MSGHTRFVGALFGVGLLLSMSSTWLAPIVHAEEAAIAAVSMKGALEAHIGKRVKIQMVSGQDLEGTLQSVGSELVVIKALTGMEFFGATVRLDQIAAVITRTETP